MDRHAEDCAGIAEDGFKPAAPAFAVAQRDWLDAILRILIARPLGLHIEQLACLLWDLRFPEATMPPRFRVQVQGILGRYSSQSVGFRQRKRRPAENLFYSPEGKGSGTWTVHQAAAAAWLQRR